MAHTPGPWYMAGDYIEADGPEGPRDRTVASVVPFHQKERQANARLIAAAPEMLDLLQTARVICESAGHRDLAARMWDVIGRAEGRNE